MVDNYGYQVVEGRDAAYDALAAELAQVRAQLAAAEKRAQELYDALGEATGINPDRYLEIKARLAALRGGEGDSGRRLD